MVTFAAQSHLPFIIALLYAYFFFRLWTVPLKFIKALIQKSIHIQSFGIIKKCQIPHYVHSSSKRESLMSTFVALHMMFVSVRSSSATKTAKKSEIQLKNCPFWLPYRSNSNRCPISRISHNPYWWLLSWRWSAGHWGHKRERPQ